jgi:hypothetical protein
MLQNEGKTSKYHAVKNRIVNIPPPPPPCLDVFLPVERLLLELVLLGPVAGVGERVGAVCLRPVAPPLQLLVVNSLRRLHQVLQRLNRF